jgi:hypothetical protein
VAGFARSFGMQVPAFATATAQETAEQLRVEWLKPVMFTAGVGWLDDAHTVKGAPEAGMLVCKMGGPAYRIGELQLPCACCTYVLAGQLQFAAVCRHCRLKLVRTAHHHHHCSPL